MLKWEIKRGQFTIKIEESEKLCLWKIYEGATLRAHGSATDWTIVKREIVDNAKTITGYPVALEGDIIGRPSELQLQKSLSLLPAPTNDELIPVQLDIGYNALGCRSVSGTWIRKGADGIYEARIPLSAFGDCPLGNPFDDSFRGNFAHGRANNRDMAIKLAILDAAKTAALLWL